MTLWLWRLHDPLDSDQDFIDHGHHEDGHVVDGGHPGHVHPVPADQWSQVLVVGIEKSPFGGRNFNLDEIQHGEHIPQGTKLKGKEDKELRFLNKQ